MALRITPHLSVQKFLDDPEFKAKNKHIENELRINQTLDQLEELKNSAGRGSSKGDPNIDIQAKTLELKLIALLENRDPAAPASTNTAPRLLLHAPAMMASRLLNAGLALIGANKRVTTRALVSTVLYALDTVKPWGIPLIKRPRYDSQKAQINLLNKWSNALDFQISDKAVCQAVMTEPDSRHFVQFLHELRTLASYSRDGLPLEKRLQLKNVVLELHKDDGGTLTRTIFNIAKQGMRSKDIDGNRRYLRPGALDKLEQMHRALQDSAVIQLLNKIPANPDTPKSP